MKTEISRNIQSFDLFHIIDLSSYIILFFFKYLIKKRQVDFDDEICHMNQLLSIIVTMGMSQFENNNVYSILITKLYLYPATRSCSSLN